MKKITLLMLLAALFMPMTTNAQLKKRGEAPVKVAKTVKANVGVTAVKPNLTFKLNAVAPKAEVPEGFAQVTLTAGNVWDDGTGYQMLLDADATAYGAIIPETGGLSTSGDVSADIYAEFEYKIPENADGALATANIVINNSVTILIPAGTYDWCITNPTPGDRMWIASSNGTVGGRADDFEFASGAAYEFVVSLGGQNDQVDLVVDDPTAPALPTNVYVTPTATTGDVAWTPGENNETWNLRWRPWTDPALLNPDWNMNVDNYLDVAGEFMIYDADGDGENWGLAYADDANYDVCFNSESWSSSTWAALTPDNWLITPAVGMGGTLKFKTWNYSTSYPDQIYVYYAPASAVSGETFNTDDFIMISDGAIVPGTTPEEYEFDLSDFEGMGVIAFRHYGVSDMYNISVGYLEITVPGAQEPAEWTVVENVTNPYTIEGLTPETEYEVQVQAVGPDTRTTDWTESTIFTTLAEEPQPTHTYTVAGSPAGFFGTSWDPTIEANDMTLNAETGVYEWTSTEATLDADANVEFKVVQDHSWDVSYGLNGGVDNVVLTAEKAGKYTLTVYFDPQNNNNVTGELTLIEEVGMNEFYLVGGFNNWGNDGGVPIKFEEVENGVFEAKADMTQGDEFKVITYDVDGSIIWMGGTDETGVGHYDVTTELLGVPTALYVGEGSNFMLAAESAVYKVRVTEAATTGLKGLTAPLQIEVVYYAPTAIENLNTDSKVDNTYYNLQGVKFNGMPSVPGIYINGGKKVIVK